MNSHIKNFFISIIPVNTIPFGIGISPNECDIVIIMVIIILRYILTTVDYKYYYVIYAYRINIYLLFVSV